MVPQTDCLNPLGELTEPPRAELRTMHFYRVPRCTRRSQCGPGLWIGSKCQWYRRNAQFSVSRGLVQALALPLPWQSLGERLVSCERGTIIGRHHQLPAGPSRGSRVGPSLPLGLCAHGLEPTTALAGHFAAGQALPAFRPNDSPSPRGRQRP